MSGYYIAADAFDTPTLWHGDPTEGGRAVFARRQSPEVFDEFITDSAIGRANADCTCEPPPNWAGPEPWCDRHGQPSAAYDAGRASDGKPRGGDKR